jgi:hypothetical protein
MPRSVYPIIARLFGNLRSPGKANEFTWRLIHRRRRPFLLLPASDMSTRVSLSLYSAQRRRAKIWRALLPLVLRSPVAMVFHRVRFNVSENSDIIRFLAEQSGVPVEDLPTPAIKFSGGAGGQKSRLVLLACDQTERPVKVIKLGLDAAGRADTDREADLLEKLPVNTIGCTRLTGRLRTSDLSAFATDYFPGESPDNDLGMELLFQSWINPGEPVPIETLDVWRELETEVARVAPAAWRVLRPLLAGKRVRTTLYHGDFAPWNIRAINSQNLQAFDWERGNLHGVPGWDWFHFVVQTSVLAQRRSVVRVAAEVEELLKSPRFRKYAGATEIRFLARPLLLAYLLHHRWVIKPIDGARQTEELYELLAHYWNLAPTAAESAARTPEMRPSPAPAGVPPGFWADACGQLKSAASQLANVFWEPTLTAETPTSISSQVRHTWQWMLLCSGWLTLTVIAQGMFMSHVTMMPFTAVAGLVATWKMNRRWGTFFAALGAVLGPWVAAVQQSGYKQIDLLCWNTLMRFIIFQMGVFFADRIHNQKYFLQQIFVRQRRPVNFAENWAIVCFSAVALLLIGWGDFLTGPRVIFLPLYLIPAILITLYLNLTWGTAVVLLAAMNAAADEYFSGFNTNFYEVFLWNFPMRFIVMYAVIVLFDGLRQESILFTAGKANGNHKQAASAGPAA